jgi:Zn-dependent M16 (insulinase) family peptidase
MATIKQLQKELNKLQERRIELLNEREQSRREIAQLRHEAAERVLDCVDIDDLVEQRNKQELLIEANISAIDLVDVRIRIARDLLDAEQSHQANLERDTLAQLEREQALYR